MLNDAVHCGYPRAHISTHHTTIISGDNLLLNLLEMEEFHIEDTALFVEAKPVVSHFQSNNCPVNKSEELNDKL